MSPKDERAELSLIEMEMDLAEAVVLQQLRTIRRDEDAAREAAEQLKPRYQCEACDHVCQQRDMGADYYWAEYGEGESAEGYSNHICPNCQVWHDGLRPGEGWKAVAS